MNEVIFLQFGNYSNYVFSHFWNLMFERIKADPNGIDLEKVFRIDDSSFIPRSIMVDFKDSLGTVVTEETKQESSDAYSIY